MVDKDKTGKELERRVAEIYRRLGASKVKHDVDIAGNQIDVYAEMRTLHGSLHRIAIEARDHAKLIGVGQVNKFALIAKLLRSERLIDEAVIVSQCGFTKPARKSADTHGILLLEIADLEALVPAAKAGATPEAAVRAVPLAPTPYIPDRDAMPKNWTGRRAEMDELDCWLKDANTPTCCMVAHGGTGKSTLSWAWLHDRVERDQEALGLDGIFQCSFYEGELSFQRFLGNLCAYLNAPAGDDPIAAIAQQLDQKRVLLVLDGFERLLSAYAAPDAALLPERSAEELVAGERRCMDWPAVRFLRHALCASTAKTLVISRLVPQELDGRDGWRPMDLPGLDPEDAADYLRACGIKGGRRELKDAAAVYAFHPLSLSKLVTALHYDPKEPDDISQAHHYDVTGDLMARQHHILERAYNTLPAEVAQFLGGLAALRGKADIGVARFLSGGWTDAQFAASLRRLDEERWVQWRAEERTIEMHPVVRRYVYMRLADKVETHDRLATYFQPLADAVSPISVKSFEDLSPVIELYHHTVRAGRYEEARQLFHDRLAKPLYYRFGAYQTFIELLRALFPDGEDLWTGSEQAVLPRLKDEATQAWTLAVMANAYSMSGQPSRAIPLFETANAISERCGYKLNLVIGLGNLACIAQIGLGQIKPAEENYRRSIALRREISNKYREAIGHQELGRLLSYRGIFDEAQEELDSALRVFGDMNDQPSQGIIWSYRALRAMLMGEPAGALRAARRARELADEFARNQYPVERDFVRAEWLLGEALTAKAAVSKRDRKKRLWEAEQHLTEALTRCRRINLVETEPDILLAWAHWHHVSGESTQARECADEALRIADRCEYRLKQADAHNFLARLDMEAGDPKSALKHAEIARERAWCDGPPYCYKPALEEADRLLKELGAKPPKF